MPISAIIGAGVSGLAAAIRLGREGHHVHVFEKAAGPGGKMAEIHLQGFRFDTGPSLFTWPSLVEELIPLLDEQGAPAWAPLDLITRYFWDDGTCLDALADPNEFAKEIEMKLGEPAWRITQYLAGCKALFKLTKPVFLERNPASLSTLFSWHTLKSLPGLPSLKAMQSLHDFNRKTFDHPYVIQLFDRYATYNGSNPYVAPATLRVIAHLEHNDGAFFPSEGMHQLAQSLYQTALKHGVTFHFQTPVTAIHSKQNHIHALTAGDHEFNLDFLLSAMDIRSFYQDVLGNENGMSNQGNIASLSSSAVIFFWGMGQSFPELSLHNVFFANNYQNEFTHIFHQNEISDDVTVYLYISCKSNPSDAPAGQENWFVMINAPVDNGQNWERLVYQARKSILQRLCSVLGRDIEVSILAESVISPPDLEKRTSAYKGAIYGSHSNGVFSAFQRHSNRSKHFDNLFFAGGTVHPGGGIPLCLLSARMATDQILNT